VRIDDGNGFRNVVGQMGIRILKVCGTIFGSEGEEITAAVGKILDPKPAIC